MNSSSNRKSMITQSFLKQVLDNFYFFFIKLITSKIILFSIMYPGPIIIPIIIFYNLFELEFIKLLSL